jgi:hypothetical protein
MSLGDTFENDLIKLVFQATAIANLADNAGTGPLTNLEIALHTADPGEAGAQNTSEANYGSYARAVVARSSGGWDVTGGVASNHALVAWPECASGSSTVTYFSIGTAHTGAGKILFSGQLTQQLAISLGITPQAAVGALTASFD